MAVYICVVQGKSLSCVQLFVSPQTIQSLEFSRLEYRSRQPFPSPVDLPDPGIKPGSPVLQADSLSTELWRKSGNPHLSPHITGILLPLISLWNYSSLTKTDNLISWFHSCLSGLLRWPILCLESVFAPWINLLSLYYGSLLNSFLHEANIPHWEAIPGTQMWLAMWPSSLASVSFLHHFYHYKKAENRTNCFQTMDSRQYRAVITEKKGQVSELCSPLVHLPGGNFWTAIQAERELRSQQSYQI